MIGASVQKLVNVELVMKEFIQRVGILLVDGGIYLFKVDNRN